MEQTEKWKQFLNKNITVIVDDLPSPYPKSKVGILLEVTDTHLILLRENKTEALRLGDVRRIEVSNGN